MAKRPPKPFQTWGVYYNWLSQKIPLVKAAGFKIGTLIAAQPELIELFILANKYPINTKLSVKHDGFSGAVRGYYFTNEAKPGLVLQMNGNKVIHVYSTKWFETS